MGDSGVGKSSFIHQFASNTFKPAFQATIGGNGKFCRLGWVVEGGKNSTDMVVLNSVIYSVGKQVEKMEVSER